MEKSDKVKEKTFTLSDIKEGSSYEFRVSAVNKAGQGPASAPVKYGQSSSWLIILLDQRFSETLEKLGTAEFRRISRRSLTVNIKVSSNLLAKDVPASKCMMLVVAILQEQAFICKIVPRNRQNFHSTF